MQKPSDYSCCHADELFPTLLPGMYTYVPPCEHAHFVAILSWRPQYDFPKTTGGQRAYGLFRKFIRFENMGFPLFIYWIKATIHHQAFCLILVSGLSHQSKTLFSLNQSDVSPFSQPIRCFAFNASADHRRYILYWEVVYMFCARFRNMCLLDSCPPGKSRWTIFPKGLFAALSRPLSLKTQIMITRVGELCVFRVLATARP